jgi:hypothetical protein
LQIGLEINFPLVSPSTTQTSFPIKKIQIWLHPKTLSLQILNFKWPFSSHNLYFLAEELKNYKIHCRHKSSIKHLTYPLNIDNLKAIYDSSFEIETETENVELKNCFCNFRKLRRQTLMMTSVTAGWI